MDQSQDTLPLVAQVARSKAPLIGAVVLLATSMFLTSGFSLFGKTAYFDDSFIYLHMAANIVELGTARYFPIADSGMLLASSPLRLLTLLPGFMVLDGLNAPLRTIEAARFAFLASGFVAFLVFLPFWANRLKTYMLAGTVFFLLGASLDTMLLMEGGVLFLSLFTLVKLLVEREENHATIGIVLLLIGLSRPEIGVVAIVCTALVHLHQPRFLLRIMLGLLLAFSIYCILMLALGVFPIPSTIWSKQVTGSLKLFTEFNLLQILPATLAKIVGSTWVWVGWVLIASPVVFSLALRKGSIPVLFCIASLLAIASLMPGNFVWYTENFLIAFLAIMAAVAIEIHRRGMFKTSYALAGIACLALAATLATNIGSNKNYPWNEGAPSYRAYQEVGASAVGDGKYVIARYSSEPVRIRMCEIGIVSFFSGPDAWIYDICGLAQIGNLKGASQSWLRHFYPSSFVETGEDQLSRLPGHATRVIDVWALSSKEEAMGAVGICQFVEDPFCINEYK
jgi:hypothetical protein